MKAPASLWRFPLWFAAGFVAAAALVGVLFRLNLGVPTASTRWQADLAARKRSAARSKPSPKLAVVGGSSALLGISAREIERATGCPSVNVGMHGAMSPGYILDFARTLVGPGDTVLLVFEYELYRRNSRLDHGPPDDLFVDYLVSRDPGYLGRRSLSERWRVFMSVPFQRLGFGLASRLRLAPTNRKSGIYDSSLLNDWGDQTGQDEAARPAGALEYIRIKTQQQSFELPDRSETLELIQAFARWAAARDVRLLATFPNFCEPPPASRDALARMAEALERFYGSLGIPVLGRHTDALLPLEQFFDHPYHLTSLATQARTRRLIPLLAPHLPARR